MSFIEAEVRRQSGRFHMSEFQSHDFFELYFLFDGTREVFLENKHYVLCAPSLCVIAPYLIHKTEGEAYMRINLYLSRDLLTEAESAFLDSFSEHPAVSLRPEQAQLLSALLAEAATASLPDSRAKRAYLLAFSHTVLAYLSQKELTPLSPLGQTPDRPTHQSTAILQIVGYINENYAQQINLDSLSRRFFLSKNSLCKQFRRTMKCSLMQYVTYVRLCRAQMYLSQTQKHMEEIARLCGFSCANYFSLSFKKQFGMSPLAYRKKN